MKIVIVIPTYNERENIKNIVPEIIKVTEEDLSNDYAVLVVDGNSPDGTGAAVEELSSEYPNVHLLLEPEKRGLGAAYIYGFKHAMEEMDADIIIEMDADFQHDPGDLPLFVQEIENGADYVIGSRFIKGGSISSEWPLTRKALSVGGNIFSKFVLGIFDVSDFTTGFKASRVKGFVDKIDLDNILSAGFAYKIDLLHKMHRSGAIFKEVPITFRIRDSGESKMEKSNALDSLKVVVLLRFRELKTFLRFAVVGFIGFLSDVTIFNFFLWQTNLSENRASNLSGFIAINVTFILNNFWSFDSRKMTQLKTIFKKAPLYYLISYVPIFFRSVILIPFALDLVRDTVLVANMAFILGIGLGLVWNFVFYSKIIWNGNNHG